MRQQTKLLYPIPREHASQIICQAMHRVGVFLVCQLQTEGYCCTRARLTVASIRFAVYLLAKW